MLVFSKYMKNIKSILAVFSLVIVFALSASAQNVTFTSLGGEKIDLASQKGKVVVLAIGASWLPLSKDQAAAINKLSRKYNGRDVVFYFIATDSTSAKSKNYASDEQVRKFGETSKLTVSILRDADGVSTVKQYKIDQLPAFVILDKEGKLVGEPFSGVDSDPKNDISVLLSGKIDKVL
jgi:thiol-disulfide isomerase/thioredoxin